MSETETELTLNRRTLRKIRKELRSVGKNGNAANSFINHRRDLWLNEPDLKSQHGNSFDVYLLNELRDVMSHERQKQTLY